MASDLLLLLGLLGIAVAEKDRADLRDETPGPGVPVEVMADEISATTWWADEEDE